MPFLIQDSLVTLIFSFSFIFLYFTFFLGIMLPIRIPRVKFLIKNIPKRQKKHAFSNTKLFLYFIKFVSPIMTIPYEKFLNESKDTLLKAYIKLAFLTKRHLRYFFLFIFSAIIFYPAAAKQKSIQQHALPYPSINSGTGFCFFFYDFFFFCN